MLNTSNLFRRRVARTLCSIGLFCTGVAYGSAQSGCVIHLYRPTNAYFNWSNIQVVVDDTLLVEVDNGGSVQLPISPGAHQIRTKSSSIRVVAQDSSTTYLRVFFEYDLLFGKPRVLEVSRGTAATELAGSSTTNVELTEVRCELPPKGSCQICPEFLDASGRRTNESEAHLRRETFRTWRAWSYPGSSLSRDGCLITCMDSASCAFVPGSLMDGLYALRNKAARIRVTYLFRQGQLLEMTEFDPRSGAVSARYEYTSDAWHPANGEKIRGVVLNPKTGMPLRRNVWSVKDGAWIRRRLR